MSPPPHRPISAPDDSNDAAEVCDGLALARQHQEYVPLLMNEVVASLRLSPEATPSYTPPIIGASQIRLLTVEPGHYLDHVRCRMEVVDLSDNLSYEALSYRWGNPKLTVPIWVNDCQTQVTMSLALALRRFREGKSASELDHTRLWIDAICIRQDSAQEQVHAIAMMGKVFGGATSVRVWLGWPNIRCPLHQSDTQAADRPRGEPGDTSSGPQGHSSDIVQPQIDGRSRQPCLADLERVFDVETFEADQVYRKSLQARSLNDVMLDMRCGILTLDRICWYLKNDLKSLPFTHLNALAALLERPYWRRNWIIQEIVLAKSITFYYGPWKLSYGTARDLYCLSTFMGMLDRRQFNTNRRLQKCDKSSEKRAAAQRHFDEVDHVHQRFGRLVDVIFSISTAHRASHSIEGQEVWGGAWPGGGKSTRELDHVYSSFGLVPMSWRTKIDYTQSRADVFADFTYNILQAKQALDLLSYAMSGTADLPSWAIDWSRSSKHNMPSNAVPCSAGAAAPFSLRRRAKTSITVPALCVGKVTDVADHMVAARHYRVFESSVIDIIVLKNCIDIYIFSGMTGGFDVIPPAVARSFLMVQRKPCIEVLTKAVGDHYQAMQKSRRYTYNWLQADIVDYYVKELVECLKARDMKYNYVGSELHRVLRDKRFFMVGAKYSGLADTDVAPGDLIVVFASARHAYCIRAVKGLKNVEEQQGQSYRLISQCYVDGIMYGEAVKQAMQDRAEETGREVSVEDVFEDYDIV